MTDESSKTPNMSPAQRLCSEIQLFDLCDLDTCSFKCNRFCTNDELIAKFESIKEEDDAAPLVYDESEDDIDDLDDEMDDFKENYEDDE